MNVYVYVITCDSSLGEINQHSVAVMVNAPYKLSEVSIPAKCKYKNEAVPYLIEEIKTCSGNIMSIYHDEYLNEILDRVWTEEDMECLHDFENDYSIVVCPMYMDIFGEVLINMESDFFDLLEDEDYVDDEDEIIYEDEE